MTELTYRAFSADLKAVFLSRPNRFLILARGLARGLDREPDREIKALSSQPRPQPLPQPQSRPLPRPRPLEVHCANPGRMREILRPGAELILERASGGGRRTEWTLAAAYRHGNIVPLISARASALAGALVLPALYPGAELESEKTLEHSRIDWRILEDGETWLEVKACSLVEEGRGMFPDAPSQRAVKHIGELVRAAGRGARAEVLFMVMNPSARVFSPNPHTDPAFTLALADAVRRGLGVRAVSVSTDSAGRSRVANWNLPVDLSPEILVRRDEGLLIRERDGGFEVERRTGDLEKRRRNAGGLVIRGPLKLFDTAEEELGGMAGDEGAFIEWLLHRRHADVFSFPNPRLLEGSTGR